MSDHFDLRFTRYHDAVNAIPRLERLIAVEIELYERVGESVRDIAERLYLPVEDLENDKVGFKISVLINKIEMCLADQRRSGWHPPEKLEGIFGVDRNIRDIYKVREWFYDLNLREPGKWLESDPFIYGWLELPRDISMLDAAKSMLVGDFDHAPTPVITALTDILVGALFDNYKSTYKPITPVGYLLQLQSETHGIGFGTTRRSNIMVVSQLMKALGYTWAHRDTRNIFERSSSFEMRCSDQGLLPENFTYRKCESTLAFLNRLISSISRG